MYLVTEPVRSFEYTMNSLVFDNVDREKFIMMGLQQVVSAVSFLNNDCGLIHGNVCSLSVVVTDALDWKLFAFDLTTEHSVVSQLATAPPLLASSWLVGPQYKSGELGRSEWDVIAQSPVWAVDAWGLGCLIQEAFSDRVLVKMEDLKNIEKIPQKIKPYYQKLLASQPARRLNPADLLDSGVLKNDLLAMVTFLQNLAMKDSIEKDSFFQRLGSNLGDIPQALAQRKILPLLASALEYGGAPPSALSTLLILAKTLDQDAIDMQVIPVVIKLFSAPDRGIRRSLLENIPSFGPGLSNQLVEEQIYPKLQSGFTDVNPYIRELTLKSMVILGPKLNSRTLNQSLLKYLAKLQVDEEPGIRANTTVLLGSLASSFNESTRKKVLLNAFSRALKDPFPPARVAALKALLTTASYHSVDDTAMRILPMISPICVDSVQEVRQNAMSCLETFIDKLKNHQSVLDEQMGMQGGAKDTTSSGGGIMGSLGWGTSAGAPAADSTIQPLTEAPKPTIITPPNHRHAHSSSGISESFKQPLPEQDEEEQDSSRIGTTETSGWEEDQDILEEMMDAAAAEREARARLNALSVSQKPRATAPVTKKPAPSRRKTEPRKPGMKLGAKKLSSSTLDDDDNFKDW